MPRYHVTVGFEMLRTYVIYADTSGLAEEEGLVSFERELQSDFESELLEKCEMSDDSHNVVSIYDAKEGVEYKTS